METKKSRSDGSPPLINGFRLNINEKKTLIKVEFLNIPEGEDDDNNATVLGFVPMNPTDYYDFVTTILKAGVQAQIENDIDLGLKAPINKHVDDNEVNKDEPRGRN